jgi:glycosyltransferase involved in cell wall biosynthesis
MSPRVSIVMPAYQAERTVGAAISSVLSQTYEDIELLVVDDGSTDATARIAEAYGGRVRVIVSRENAGSASARNLAIDNASGELIALCDADDFLLPGHIQALVAVYDRIPGIVCGNLQWLLPKGIPARGTRYKGNFPKPDMQRHAILRGNFVSIASLFPHTMVEEFGPFDESMRRGEDWELWMRGIFGGYRVTLQPRPLALYRKDGGSAHLSSDVAAMDAALFDVLRRALVLDLTDEERAYVDWRLGEPGPGALNLAGEQALMAGRYREAARLLRQTASLLPNERPLVRKARVLSALPAVAGPVLRRRDRRREVDYR